MIGDVNVPMLALLALFVVIGGWFGYGAIVRNKPPEDGA